jgi:hypothetical protein
MMPLSSTLSLLWIAGVFFFSSQARRFIRRQINRLGHRDTIAHNITAHAARFFGFAARYIDAPQAGIQPNSVPCLSRNGNHLIMRNGDDVYTPNGRKIHGIGENMECSICFESLTQSHDGSAPAVKVLECCHVFHSQCISDWYSQHELCPICRDTSSSLRNLRDFFFT